MKKKIGLIALAILFLAILIVPAYFSMRERTPQDRAVSYMKAYERLMAGYMGRGYKPVQFAELTPVCLSDGTIIGYYIDHRFYNSDTADPRNLCEYRFFLDESLVVVGSEALYMKTPEQLDSIGLAVLKR